MIDHVVTLWDVLLAIVVGVPGLIGAVSSAFAMRQSNRNAKQGTKTAQAVEAVHQSVDYVKESVNGGLTAAKQEIIDLKAEVSRLKELIIVKKTTTSISTTE